MNLIQAENMKLFLSFDYIEPRSPEELGEIMKEGLSETDRRRLMNCLSQSLVSRALQKKE